MSSKTYNNNCRVGCCKNNNNRWQLFCCPKKKKRSCCKQQQQEAEEEENGQHQQQRSSMNNTTPTSSRNNNNNKLKVCNNIMIGLSVSDTITSLMYLLGTVLVPEGQAWGSHGTKATCTFQGLLIWYFNPCSRMYSATLSICYVMMVRYGYTEDSFKRRYYVQWFLLGFPHLIAILVALPLLIDQSYNFDQVSVCGPSTYPTWCNRYADGSDNEDTVCIRGGILSVGGTKVGTKAFKIMAPIDMYLAGIIIVVCMIMLFWTVRQREKRNERYNFNPQEQENDSNNDNHHNHNTTATTTTTTTITQSSSSLTTNNYSSSFRNIKQHLPTTIMSRLSLLLSTSTRNNSSNDSRRRSRSTRTSGQQPLLQSTMVGIQGLFYCLAYWFAVGPFFVLMTIYWFGFVDYKSRPEWLSPLIIVTLPSQGIFNCLIYLRPRFMTWYRRKRREHKERKEQKQERREQQVVGADDPNASSGASGPNTTSTTQSSSSSSSLPGQFRLPTALKLFFFHQRNSSSTTSDYRNNASSVQQNQQQSNKQSSTASTTNNDPMHHSSSPLAVCCGCPPSPS